MYEKLTKFKNFTRHQKNARILGYITFARKLFFRDFFWAGEGSGNPLAPVSYAYSWALYIGLPPANG